MYPVDKSDLPSFFKQLKIPSALEKLCLSKSPRENLFGVSEPYKVYSSYGCWDDSEVPSFVPLWESGTEVFAYNLEQKNYCIFSMETLSQGSYFQSRSIMGPIAVLLFSAIEMELDSSDSKDLKSLKRSRELAQSLGFKFLPELASFVHEFQKDFAAGGNKSQHDALIEFCQKHDL